MSLVCVVAKPLAQPTVVHVVEHLCGTVVSSTCGRAPLRHCS